MNDLMKIAYNCRKATLLIEKKQITVLTLREKMELKFHLAGCSVCRIFEKQSTMINQMVKNLFKEAEQRVIRLDDEYKKEMQEKIEAKLNK